MSEDIIQTELALERAEEEAAKWKSLAGELLIIAKWSLDQLEDIPKKEFERLMENKAYAGNVRRIRAALAKAKEAGLGAC